MEENDAMSFATEVYLVMKNIHYDQNWPLRAFETEEEAEEWRDKEAEKYDEETNETGSTFLVGEMGTRFNLGISEVPLGWEDE